MKKPYIAIMIDSLICASTTEEVSVVLETIARHLEWRADNHHHIDLYKNEDPEVIRETMKSIMDAQAVWNVQLKQDENNTTNPQGDQPSS